MPILLDSVASSVPARRLSLKKRLRWMRAMWSQQWHQKVCGECKASWWVEGKPRPELIAICDDCESRLLDRMMDDLERDHQQQQRQMRRA